MKLLVKNYKKKLKLHTYRILKLPKLAFIKNLIFKTFRDPWFLHHRHVNLALVFAKTFLLHCWLVCQVGKCQGWTCLLVCCHIVCQTSENSGNSGHLGLSIKPTQLISPVCPSLALLGAHTLKVFNKSSRGAIVYSHRVW